VEKRISFIDENSRRLFFDEVYSFYKVSSWKNIYSNLSISRSVFEKYKSGYLTMPYSLYLVLISKFSNGFQQKFLNYVKILDSNWGSVKGGKVTYSKNKKLFDKGRQKAINVIKEKAITFDINMPLNRDLAYFIGLFVGDGFTNKYGFHYIFQFVGHKQELGFYKNEVIPMAKKLFNITPSLREDKMGNFIRVDYYSSCLFRLTTERFKINRGVKSRTVLIPEEILNGERRYLLAFIAGVYDAECCIFFDKRKKYQKPYPRIDLHMANLGILNQIKTILDEELIVSNVFIKNSRLLIYGDDNIRRFLKKVPIRNPKHVNKLKEQNLI